MRIGIPREIKNGENRVALAPDAVAMLCQQQHSVAVEHNAGLSVGYTDDDYLAAGALIQEDAGTLWQFAELVVKVKEPQAEEYPFLRDDLLLFCYLHLAPAPELTNALLSAGTWAAAFETLESGDGQLPLLKPMSEIAGRMSVQAGAHTLQKQNGGRGLLLGGVPGVEPATVIILGGGTVGGNALRIAVGMGARVTVLDRNPEVLRALDNRWGQRIATLYATPQNMADAVQSADLVVGAVLVAGGKAPVLIDDGLLSRMRPGSVIVDVAIDQGGISVASKPTTHAQPAFDYHGVMHYCVANMPGAVAVTATRALSNAVLPRVLELARLKHRGLIENPAFAGALNTAAGHICHARLAEDINHDYMDPARIGAPYLPNASTGEYWA